MTDNRSSGVASDAGTTIALWLLPTVISVACLGIDWVVRFCCKSRPHTPRHENGFNVSFGAALSAVFVAAALDAMTPQAPWGSLSLVSFPGTIAVNATAVAATATATDGAAVSVSYGVLAVWILSLGLLRGRTSPVVHVPCLAVPLMVMIARLVTWLWTLKSALSAFPDSSLPTPVSSVAALLVLYALAAHALLASLCCCIGWDRLSFSSVAPLLRDLQAPNAAEVPLGVASTVDLPASLACEATRDAIARHWPLERGRRKWSPLAMFVLRLWWKQLSALAVLRVFIELLGLISPVLLRVLVENFGAEGTAFDVYRSIAIVYGIALASLVGTVCRTQSDFALRRIAIEFRAAISLLIYDHAALRPGHARGDTTAADLVNRLTVDAFRVCDQIPSVNDVWALPFQVSVTLYLLYLQVGLAFLAGLGLAVILIAVNVALAKKIGAVNVRLMSSNDERVLRVTEVIDASKSVIACGIAGRLRAWLMEPRDAFMVSLRWIKLLDAWCVFFWATTPIFVTLTTFATYVWMGDALQPGRTIAALALFNILILPLNAYPWVINGTIEMLVSARRLASVFAASNPASDDPAASGTRTPPRERDPLLSPQLPYSDVEDNDDAGESPYPRDRRVEFGASWIDAREVRLSRGDGSTSPLCDVAAARVEVSVEAGAQSTPPPPSLTLPTSSVDGDVAAPRRFVLSVGSFRVCRGEVVGVIGPPGGGKSTLLAGIIGEAEMRFGSQVGSLEGRLNVAFPHRSVVGYVGQTPFMLAGSIRDNVLFGLPFEPVWFTEVVRAVALDEDLTTIDGGDEAPVGERGCRMSGGQLVRIALARALYARPTLLLRDEPFSALDPCVGRHVALTLRTFAARSASAEQSLRYESLGDAVGAGIVIATHSTHLLDLVRPTRVYRCVDGLLTEGTLPHSVFAEEGYRSPHRPIPRHWYECTEDTATTSVVTGGSDAIEKGTSDEETGAAKVKEVDAVDREMAAGRSGTIDPRTVSAYARRVGLGMCAAVVVLIGAMQAARNSSDILIVTMVENGTAARDGSHMLQVIGYVAAANAVLAAARSFVFAFAGLRGAARTHNALLDNVLAAPLSFFETTSGGTIVNRLARDVYAVDDSIPFTVNILFAQFFLLLGSACVITFSSGSPVVVVVFAPTAIAFYWIQRPYRIANREIKRLESACRTPVIDRLWNLIDGGATIRAFGVACAERFLRKAEQDLSAFLRLNWNMLLLTEWFGFRLQLIGCAVVAVVGVSTVVYRAASADHGRSALLGLALAYVGPLVSYLQGLLGAYTETEKLMVSVERIEAFATLSWDSDPHPSSLSKERHSSTPTTETGVGSVVLHNVFARYGPLARRGDSNSNAASAASPNVLHGVSLKVARGEHVAVVGRTGSGKTSLLGVLLKLLTVTRGTIEVNGCDISSMDATSLRLSIAVLPQAPFLFHGALRANADPFGERSDSEVREALDAVGLTESGGFPLTRTLTQGGRGLSAGQRHLVALARILLSRSSIVLLDEPAANFDEDTRKRWWSVMKSRLQGRTVIVVTHHVEELAATFDKVVTMRGGEAEVASVEASGTRGWRSES